MPFSPEEAKKILHHAPEELVNFFGIGFKLGLRPEEILGLKEEDVDFITMSVHVHHVITHGVYKLVSKQKGGPRNAPLFFSAIKYLKDQISRAKDVGSEFLFFDLDGNHLLDSIDIRGEKGHDFYWNTFLEDLEIFPIRKMKNTRHTFAVQAIKSNKFTLQEIASMMGHSSLRMLFQHYGKYLGDANASVDRKIDIFDC